MNTSRQATTLSIHSKKEKRKVFISRLGWLSICACYVELQSSVGNEIVELVNNYGNFLG